MVNLKFALRTLFKTPFVTIVAIVSLALGIGANAAIFSLFNQLLLKPLDVPQAARLVNLTAPGPKPGSTSCNQAGPCDAVFSYPMFRDLERVQTPFTGIAAHVSFGANLAARGQTENGEGLLVSGSYFAVLGLQPAIGRLLGPDDDKVVGESHVVEAKMRERGVIASARGPVIRLSPHFYNTIEDVDMALDALVAVLGDR